MVTGANSTDQARANGFLSVTYQRGSWCLQLEPILAAAAMQWLRDSNRRRSRESNAAMGTGSGRKAPNKICSQN